MVSLRKINPMVRSIGTIGVVAALVGGITFASLSSNTVALSPNDLTTATAVLAIAGGCPGTGTSLPGLSDTSLAPGGSTSVSYCLTNTGTVPLTVTASIPQTLTGTAASETTLTLSCPSGEGTVGPQALNGYTGAFQNPLAAGASDSCTATATLSSIYNGSGGEVITPFTINFVGNE